MVILEVMVCFMYCITHAGKQSLDSYLKKKKKLQEYTGHQGSSGREEGVLSLQVANLRTTAYSWPREIPAHYRSSR